MTENGTVWWTELNTHHPKKAEKFYTELFGWQARTTALGDMSRPAKADEPGYTTFMRDGMPAFGCFHMEHVPDMKHVPEHWFTYFRVEDVDKSTAKVVAAGGKVMHAPWDIPGVGRIAIVQDSSGAAFGLGKPAMEMPAAAPAAATVKEKATKAPSKAKKPKA